MTGLARDRREAGFTLIELLVVIIIVGVLTSVAVPVFLSQRRKAADAALKADLRAAAQATESWYADGYTNSDGADPVTGNLYLSSGGDLGVWPKTAEVKAVTFPALQPSPGNGIGVRGTATNQGYCILGSNKDGSYRYGLAGVGADYAALLYWDSLAGGVVTRDRITLAGACQQYRP